jgi:hypothetical protein
MPAGALLSGRIGAATRTFTMHSWIRIFVVWMLAVLLPVQSFAATLGHCGGAGAHPVAGIGAALSDTGTVDAPCAHHALRQGGSAGQGLDHHQSHGAACAACCAVPASPIGFTVSPLPAATAFPPVIDRLAQFVPPGLKRPPSEL